MAKLRETVFVVLFCVLFPGLISAQQLSTDRKLTDVQWRQDLQAMAQFMPANHLDLFHTMTESSFNAAVRKLDRDIPALNDDQITVRLQEIGAMVRDGHSGVSVSFRAGKTNVPLRLSFGEDGIFIRSAPAQYGAVVGARILSVGGVPWQEALRRADELVDCDPHNDGERLAWQPAVALTDPLVTHGLGLSATHDAIAYEYEKDGTRASVTLTPEITAVDLLNSFGAPAGWADARGAAGEQPIAHPWVRPLELAEVAAHHAIYMQLNGIANNDDETVEQFAGRFTRMAEQSRADRLVLDLRHNPGGDNTLLRPLLIALIRSRFNYRGGMYVLIGPTTFPAAENFVNRLELYTDCIFAGQPTSQNVNFYGDPAGMELPNSHLDVEMAHLWWQDQDPRDKRTATFPEIAISADTFADYVSGKDAALDFVLRTPTPPSFEEWMSSALAGGDEAAFARYQQYAGDSVHRYATQLEKKLNTLGYHLLAEKETADAVTAFAVNARAHPDSANAFDSLGDGYAAAKDRERAIAAYRRSFELNPRNIHAKEAAEKLSAK
jgi:hypothetical protein